MRKADELSMTTAPGLDRDRRKSPGDAAAGREQRDVDALEGVFGQFLDYELLAAKRKPLACRALAGKRFQLADAKAALVHGGHELATHSAGHAGNGNNGIVGHFALLCSSMIPENRSGSHSGNKKAPDLCRRGFGSHMRVRT